MPIVLMLGVGAAVLYLATRPKKKAGAPLTGLEEYTVAELDRIYWQALEENDEEVLATISAELARREALGLGGY